MKWVAVVLLALSAIMAVAGWMMQRGANRTREEWRAAVERVQSFIKRIPEEELVRKGMTSLAVTIPSDAQWKRVVERGRNLYFVITKARIQGSALGPVPKRPLDPFEARVAVNGSPANTEVILTSVDSKLYRWGLAALVRPGDQVEVVVTVPPNTVASDNQLLLAVDYHIEKDRNPMFDASLAELFSGVAIGVGVTLAPAGALMLLFLSLSKKVRSPCHEQRPP